jgi:mRNA-degrading endonuclease RelE of RelBE toxin-antitoxin system
MKFTIDISHLATEELEACRPFDQRKITAAIHDQLDDDADVPARNRKILRDVVPDFPFKPPLWELRVGEYRIFYDIDRDGAIVNVRAVRRKEKRKRTEDLFHEKSDS